MEDDCGIADIALSSVMMAREKGSAPFQHCRFSTIDQNDELFHGTTLEGYQ
jgi:hypothetical protein